MLIHTNVKQEGILGKMAQVSWKPVSLINAKERQLPHRTSDVTNIIFIPFSKQLGP